MTKVLQTQEELKDHLKEQLHFLDVSAENFDKGDDSESKRMATAIRILLHDTYKIDGTPNSQSLLKILGLKDKISFFDSSSEKDAIGPYTGLVLKSIGPQGGSYVAPLDDFPPNHVFKRVPFKEYWEKDIFIDGKNNSFSRKKLVLAIANKDGGAHIDPELDQDYAELTKQNSLGWTYFNDSESGPLEKASSAAVRQIAHEILKTLISDYPEKKLLNTKNSAVFGDIHLVNGFSGGKLINIPTGQDSVQEVKGGKKCPCGSGKEYEDCCGK
jgi:hypothetical protein